MVVILTPIVLMVVGIPGVHHPISQPNKALDYAAGGDPDEVGRLDSHLLWMMMMMDDG